MLLILELVCIYFILTYVARSSTPAWGRMLALVFLIVGFFVPYGWILVLITGGLCWADSRMESTGSGL